ncbi:MAG: hypothetical protein ACOCVM_09400 [Desulfovibrionaceae bacterium]
MRATRCAAFKAVLDEFPWRRIAGTVWVQDREDGSLAPVAIRQGATGNSGCLAQCFPLSERENLLVELESGAPLQDGARQEANALLHRLKRALHENGI